MCMHSNCGDRYARYDGMDSTSICTEIWESNYLPATNGSNKLSLYKPTLYMLIQLTRNQFQLQSQLDVSRRAKEYTQLVASSVCERLLRFASVIIYNSGGPDTQSLQIYVKVSFQYKFAGMDIYRKFLVRVSSWW